MSDASNGNNSSNNNEHGGGGGLERAAVIFDKAIALDDAAARDQLLDHECGDDAQLRAEIASMLAAHDAQGVFLEKPSHDAAGMAANIAGTDDDATVASISEQPGQRIGNYKLLQQLGEGGFGVVYMAEQERPVQRRVALKIIKLGMDTKQVIARFEAERQALAMMDHPNIARVLDAGATETGRPYFVMELVKGEAITTYCDRHNLSIEDRLSLFQQTCNAVQHAHQKGIIHRDIKPSNVMITLHDGVPVPKVIDFGIAKATNQRLTEKTVFTEYRQFIGTPEYMSPEQAEMSGIDIDTRSDVYSLGVLLYELLTGVTPFDSQKLRSAAYNELQRIIREETPARPSTRLSTLDTLPSVAAHRHVEPKKLGMLIRGDLDWIVMKALEKDRTRRYETANGFAADIQRYLDNEPVVASPPSTTYRVRKFIRRHRSGVVAAMLLLAAMLLGVIGTTSGMVWALNERDRADEHAMQAEVKATTAQRVTDFLVSLFEASDPFRARGEEPTARDLLEFGVERIEELDNEPEAQTVMRETIAWVYAVLGRFEDGTPLIEDAVAWREKHAADDELALAKSLHILATMYDAGGKSAEAEEAINRAIEIRTRLLGRESIEVAESLNTLCGAIWHRGDFAEAEAVARETLAIRRKLLDPMNDSIGQSLHNLGSLRFLQGDLEEAQEYYGRAIEINRHNGDDDTHGFATTLHTLAMVYESLGRYEDALELQWQSLPLREKTLGEEHWHVALSLTTIGNIYVKTHRAAEAEPLLRRAVSNGEKAWGEGHHDLMWMRWNLARCLVAQGKLDEAQALMEHVVAMVDEHEIDFIRSTVLNELADVHLAQERFDEVERVAKRAITAATQADGAESLAVALSRCGLARAYAGQRRFDEAIELFGLALPVMRDALAGNDADLLRAERDRIRVLLDANRLDDATTSAQRVVDHLRGVADAEGAHPRDMLLAARWLLDCPAESLRDSDAALQLATMASDRAGGGHPEFLEAVASAQHATGKRREARSTLTRAIGLLDDDDSRRAWLDGRLADLND